MNQYKLEIDELYKKYSSIIKQVEDNQIVYHYTSPTGLLGIVNSNELWFTDSDYLNDSSESEYFHDIFSEVFDEISETKFIWNAYLVSFFHSGSSSGRKTYNRNWEKRNYENRYILSLSVDRDNLNLWNYYTKNPSRIGYNLGIDIYSFIPNLEFSNNERVMHGKVIYDKEEQMSILRNLLNDYGSIYKELKYSYQRDYLYTLIESNIVELSVFMKNPSFRNESEYRIAIVNTTENQKQNVEIREDLGVFIPFIKKPFNKTWIREIGISPTNRSPFAEKSLKKFALEKELNIEVFSSKIPLRY